MIELRTEHLTVLLSPVGARLVGLWYGSYPHSLVLGAPDDAASSGTFEYFGALIGPVANRISGATIEIDGRSWRLPMNEGNNCLHSGPTGLHALRWDTAKRSDNSMTFEIALQHGHGGLPGNRNVTATYSLDGPTLTLVVDASTDHKTPVNIAHHPYWKLSQNDTIADHILKVAADTYLPVTAETCPTGEIASVQNTDFDFRHPRAVPTDVTLDANFCLSPAPHSQPRFAAHLEAPSGPQLEIQTTEPGLQIYNGTGLQATDTPMHTGQQLGPCAGIALEPQRWPDAPSHDRFPSVLLPAGGIYRQITRYTFA